jgi:hypothetical protein
MVDDPPYSLRARQIISKQLSNELFIAFEEDSWLRFNKHYPAVTTPSHGTSIFAGAFDIEGGRWDYCELSQRHEPAYAG